jgi:hypothetical protein
MYGESHGRLRGLESRVVPKHLYRERQEGALFIERSGGPSSTIAFAHRRRRGDSFLGPF